MAGIKIPEIYVDGDKMNCDNPEDMKKIEDIFISISGYCLQQNPARMITSLNIDGKIIQDVGQIDVQQSCDTIRKMEFTTMSFTAIADNNLAALTEYLDKIKFFTHSYGANANTAERKKFADEVNNAFRTVMTETVEMFPSAAVCRLTSSLRDIMTQINEKALDEAPDAASATECEPLIKQAAQIIANIKEETHKASDAGVMPTEYRLTLPGMIESIDILLPKMSEVSQLLTAGKDKDAMQTVAEFSDILNNAIQFYSMLTHNGGGEENTTNVSEDFFKDLTGKLQELMNAMTGGDSILIGDLMEYEFVPALEDIKEFLTKQIQ
ncbi:MAG: hypothetical protein IKQ61_09075 [Spirochaetales bacterium]|nr:hypothetical protein [Spirochaetales bacterium]